MSIIRTYEDVENHPHFPLFSASFDNNDMAYALDLPAFADWRKTGERADHFVLPRSDQNPVRPKFGLAHVYEYALFKELTKSMPNKSASVVILNEFSTMRQKAMAHFDGRFGRLNEDLLDLLNGSGVFEKLPEGASWRDELRASFRVMVDFPWLGFDPEIFDRSPERIANPLMWIIAPDLNSEDQKALYKVIRTTGETSLVSALEIITAKVKRVYSDPLDIPDYRSTIILNVTGLLADVERKLLIRLRGKRLKSGHED